LHSDWLLIHLNQSEVHDSWLSFKDRIVSFYQNWQSNKFPGREFNSDDGFFDGWRVFVLKVNVAESSIRIRLNNDVDRIVF
jgi:hypothetical protein